MRLSRQKASQIFRKIGLTDNQKKWVVSDKGKILLWVFYHMTERFSILVDCAMDYGFEAYRTSDHMRQFIEVNISPSLFVHLQTHEYVYTHEYTQTHIHAHLHSSVFLEIPDWYTSLSLSSIQHRCFFSCAEVSYQ